MYTGPVMEDDRATGDGTAGETPDAAFGRLYEDYFSRIYDFSIRLAQDRDTAALVVQSTFLRVFRGLRAGQQTEIELQLYSGAHHDTAERLRGRRGDAEQIEEPYAAIDTSRLSSSVDDALELGRMAWSAAIELKLNDYELLDLNIRQQLNANDIGVVLAARPESVERRLADAHKALGQALTARLLFTRGRRECLDLDLQLGETEWSSSQSRRILRHADSCDVCRNTLTGYPDAGDLLAALMPVPAPATWQETILERLQEAVKGEPAASAATPAAAQAPQPSSTPTSAPTSGQTPAQRPSRPLPEFGGGGRGGGSIADWLESKFGGGGPRGPLLAALLGGLVAIGVVIGSLCAAGTFDGDGDDEPEPTVTVTITPTAEASGTPTATVTPTQSPTLEPQPQPTEPPLPTATEPPLPTATDVPTLEPPPTEPAPTETVPAPTEPAATPAPTP